MPHSLTAKLSGLKHKQFITDVEYDRLKSALCLEKEIGEIKKELKGSIDDLDAFNQNTGLFYALDVIDKHLKGEDKNDKTGSAL